MSDFEIQQWILNVRMVEIHKAGNPQSLIDWYNAGADGQIDWGSEGDFDACVSIAGKYMTDDQAKGFCQLRHMDATGAPAGKAPSEISKADKPDYTEVISDRKGEPVDQDLYDKVKSEAQSKFDVYPSAVANGWVVQEYKRRGGKYRKPVKKDDSFTPPESVQQAGKQALEWLKEGKQGDGFTDVGRKRASDLANGHPISLDTLKRMKAYFDRHQPDKDAEGFNYGESGYPSAGRVAWEAWGGNAGYSWAKRMVAQAEKVEKKTVTAQDLRDLADKAEANGDDVEASRLRYQSIGLQAKEDEAKEVKKGDYNGHVFRGNQHSHGGVISFDPQASHFTTTCASGHQNTVLVPKQWVERDENGTPTGQLAVGAQSSSCSTCNRPLANRWIMVEGRKRADNPDNQPTQGYFGMPAQNYVDVPKPR